MCVGVWVCECVSVWVCECMEAPVEAGKPDDGEDYIFNGRHEMNITGWVSFFPSWFLSFGLGNWKSMWIELNERTWCFSICKTKQKPTKKKKFLKMKEIKKKKFVTTDELGRNDPHGRKGIFFEFFSSANAYWFIDVKRQRERERERRRRLTAGLRPSRQTATKRYHYLLLGSQ